MNLLVKFLGHVGDDFFAVYHRGKIDLPEPVKRPFKRIHVLYSGSLLIWVVRISIIGTGGLVGNIHGCSRVHLGVVQRVTEAALRLLHGLARHERGRLHIHYLL